MTQNGSLPTTKSSPIKKRKFRFKSSSLTKYWPLLPILGLFLLIGLALRQPGSHLRFQSSLLGQLPDLAMSDGDPYIRALMLTISASESNSKNSYFLLYGGRHVHDLGQHPNQCMPIKAGPNQGQCSTAAGRYQFLTSTWIEKAARYHPHPHKTNHGMTYSFEPQYQDVVVYRWLNDHHQWNVDILALLKEDRVEEVLAELSDIWTSLGDGIEDNSMTPYLPNLYRQLLSEELRN
jgi:nickel/cobalt tolerance cation efflux system protein